MRHQSRFPLGYPIAENEEERLREIVAYCFNDCDMGPTLNEICLLAQKLFDMPMVLVSIVGRDTQTFAAKCGVEANGTAREDSFCTYTILEDDVLIVHDATRDPRFATNRLVTGKMHLRFYAGAPLIVRPGIRIGSLCVLDREPREFSQSEARKLQMLAGLVVNELRRRRAMIDLRRQQNVLSQTARMTKVGSWSFDIKADALVWSEETYRIFDVETHVTPTWRLQNSFWNEQWADDIEAELRAVVHVAVPFDRTVPIVTAKGEGRWIRCMAEAEIASGEVVHVIGSFQDITEQRTHAAAIEWLAFRDALTGLPNREYFQRRLAMALSQAEREERKLGLVLLDLDHFKDVNNTFGHEAGDALLCSISERLPRVYQKKDMVFRLSGDEFAVILPDVSETADVTGPTEQLLELLSSPHEQNGKSLSISASMGSALYPDDDRSCMQLLKNAEIALETAKNEGGNRHVAFEHYMRQELEERVALLREIRAGFAVGAFTLYYQPVVQLGAPDGVSCFEALMRWKHPSRGVLTPDKFSAAFDDQELSLAMGELALETAIAQMRVWMDECVPFGRVAVNLSAAQFRSGNVVELIKAKLKRWDVPAERLVLEVTENVYMGWGADLVGDTIRALHNAGIVIALDDFGTGFASLRHLTQFPIDKLKIDKSFISDMEDPAIVSAILMLGKGLGIKVVAEGVEHKYQLERLRAMGCDLVQGYYFARPMPSAEVTSFLESFGDEARACA